jgi:hypothetical protein
MTGYPLRMDTLASNFSVGRLAYHGINGFASPASWWAPQHEPEIWLTPSRKS